MEFNVRQKKVINAEEPKILCLSSAASGKTRVLTERVRVLIEEKGVPAKEIVAITFTNLAADEMKKRLGSIAEGMYIGTIHAYAARICYENNINVQHFIDTEYFDKILDKALTISRSHYPKVRHLLIDECQDLNDLNYRFINRIPAENIFFVGDEKQMIYQFRGASEKELMNIYKDVNYKKYYLIDNYRNAPSIVEFAENFLASSRHLSPLSNPVKKKRGTVVECPFREAVEELEYSGNWGSWFILGRTNAQIQEAQRILNEKGIPNISFKKGDFDLDELTELMASDKVKVLTIHTAKGLENKNVIVTGAKLYNEEERRIAYVAATRAENSLYWCPAIVSPRKQVNKKGNIFAQGNTKVIEF